MLAPRLHYSAIIALISCQEPLCTETLSSSFTPVYLWSLRYLDLLLRTTINTHIQSKTSIIRIETLLLTLFFLTGIQTLSILKLYSNVIFIRLNWFLLYSWCFIGQISAWCSSSKVLLCTCLLYHSLLTYRRGSLAGESTKHNRFISTQRMPLSQAPNLLLLFVLVYWASNFPSKLLVLQPASSKLSLSFASQTVHSWNRSESVQTST